MNRFHKGMLFVYVVGCLLFLVACGQSTPGAGSMTSLQITRSSAVSNNVFPAFTRTSHDLAKVSQLYNAIQQLPHQQSISCPGDSGLHYNLVFTQTDGAQTPILLFASGCRGIVWRPNDTRLTDSAFWSLLEQIAGVRANTLFVEPA